MGVLRHPRDVVVAHAAAVVLIGVNLHHVVAGGVVAGGVGVGGAGVAGADEGADDPAQAVEGVAGDGAGGGDGGDRALLTENSAAVR